MYSHHNHNDVAIDDSKMPKQVISELNFMIKTTIDEHDDMVKDIYEGIIEEVHL